MKRALNEKVSVLDPKFQAHIDELISEFKEHIEKLFEKVSESVSLLYTAATHDEKTGLYNNKFFETILEMEIEKAKRHQENLSLIIVDIDFFKKINDTYGHVKADDLLKQLAVVLKKQTRKSDVIARFGGEEFFILLPETDLTKAKGLAGRIKTAIHADAVLKKYGLTVSGGVTQYREKNDSKKNFKIRADKALYEAKHSGRDKFIVIE
jgi:diguanylate cyclase (GGDEF)-like protein